jgi:hypothetical protein
MLMHYKDGTEARLGDLIEAPATEWQKHPIHGYVVGCAPGAESCNLLVAYVGLLKPSMADSVTAYPKVMEGYYTAGHCTLVYREPAPSV